MFSGEQIPADTAVVTICKNRVTIVKWEIFEKVDEGKSENLPQTHPSTDAIFEMSLLLLQGSEEKEKDINLVFSILVLI